MPRKNVENSAILESRQRYWVKFKSKDDAVLVDIQVTADSYKSAEKNAAEWVSKRLQLVPVE